MSAFLFVQAIHIVSGVAWGGGQILLALGVWPALLRLPAPDAQRLLRAMEQPFGKAQMLFGTAVIVSGLCRAIWLSGVRSWAGATGTAYGLTCVAALALSVVLATRTAQTRRFHQQLFDGEQFHHRARLQLFVTHAIDVLLLVGIIACMVMMRFGL